MHQRESEQKTEIKNDSKQSYREFIVGIYTYAFYA